MKKAVFIGNCQCSGILELLKFTNFNDIYTTQQYANWQMIENYESPPTKALANADLVVYQPLSDVHGCFSTNKQNPNNMLNTCGPDTVIVSFPRIHNNSLWPIFKKHQQKRDYYGNDFIKYYFDQGMRSQRELLLLFDTHALDFRFESRFAKNMAITLEKEVDTDIKVHDYIRENIEHKNLFLTHDHPTTVVFHHCVSQLLGHLDDINFSPTFSLDALGDNITGLQDSVYKNSSCRYPASSYSHKVFGTIDDSFYRKVMINYFNDHGINENSTLSSVNNLVPKSPFTMRRF